MKLRALDFLLQENPQKCRCAIESLVMLNMGLKLDAFTVGDPCTHTHPPTEEVTLDST